MSLRPEFLMDPGPLGLSMVRTTLPHAPKPPRLRQNRPRLFARPRTGTYRDYPVIALMQYIVFKKNYLCCELCDVRPPAVGRERLCESGFLGVHFSDNGRMYLGTDGFDPLFIYGFP